MTIEEYINLKLSSITPAKYSSPIVTIPSSVPMNSESVVVPSLSSSSLVTPGVVLGLSVRGLVVGVARLVVVVMGLLVVVVVIGGAIVVGRIVVGCVDGVVVVVVVVVVTGG